MRILATVLLFVLSSLPLRAEDQVERLMAAMRMEDVTEILRNEGLSLGQDLQEAFLDSAGGPVFNDQVDRIYDAEWMRSQIAMVFQGELTNSQIERATAFFESDLGQTIVTLENSARVAMSDEAIEEMAQDTYKDIDRNSEKYLLVHEFIQVNDLIEKNVQSAIRADYNFFRGMSENVGDSTDLLAELLLEKDRISDETEAWLYSFLLLAYQPLTESQIRENIAFSRTDTGKAVNDALFESFDLIYEEIYYRLGHAIVQVLGASDL